jgi:transposase
MPENFFVEKDGKTYVYNSTSVYDASTKKKRTVTTYVGRYDPETKTIVSKKDRRSDSDFIDPDKMRAARFGGSYALLELAEGIGLRDDLSASFGRDGDKILASAVAQILSGGPLSSVEDAADGSMIRELMGLSEKLSSPRMSEFTKRTGDSFGNIETLFEKRVKRAGDVLSFDITSVSTNSAMDGWGEWGLNRDCEKMKQINIGLVTDKKGIPAMFEMYPGSVSDTKTLERTLERVRSYGADSCTFAMDRGFGSAPNLRYMIDNGISFVIPGKRGTKCVKALMSALIKSKGDPDIVRIHDGAVYSVIETDIAVVPRRKDADEDDESNDTRELELVAPDDKRFLTVPEKKRLKAFACFSERNGADENEKIQKALSGIEAKLRDADPWTAVREQKRIAGGYSKYIECRVEDNKLIIERKRNSLAFAMNRSGMFVMFSHGVDDWNDMMSCYDCRVYVEQAFDAFKNELDGNRMRTFDPVSARGRLLIKFVALMLWCKMAAVLRTEKKHVTVTAAIQSLDNIMAVGSGNVWRLTEVTKKNRELLKLLGIAEPGKRLDLKECRYTPKAILHGSE